MGRIMVVDDEPDMVFMLETMLSRSGHSVVGACSGEECLEKLKEDKFDLLLLDVVMPEMNGWEVVKEIYKDEKGPPKIAMISAMKKLQAVAKLPYDVAYIEKPFDMKDLLQKVEQLVRE